jgi:hypothetical protein
LGTDHLGSTVRTADASFTPLYGLRRTPFADARDPATQFQTDHCYISQSENASSDLYWYVARASDPVLGHFLSSVSRYRHLDSGNRGI